MQVPIKVRATVSGVKVDVSCLTCVLGTQHGSPGNTSALNYCVFFPRASKLFSEMGFLTEPTGCQVT